MAPTTSEGPGRSWKRVPGPTARTGGMGPRPGRTEHLIRAAGACMVPTSSCPTERSCRIHVRGSWLCRGSQTARVTQKTGSTKG